jgi:hypothetical protein
MGLDAIECRARAAASDRQLTRMLEGLMSAVRAATVLRSCMGLCVFSVFGCLAVARRAFLAGSAGLVLVLALSAGSVAGAHSLPGFSRRPVVSRSKPVRAVLPPATVALALQKTQAARYLVLTEASQSGPVRYVIDSLDQRAVISMGGAVSLVQIGRVVYAPRSSAGCFVSAQRPSGLLPNVAGMMLPSGIAALSYSTKWSVS